MIRSVRLVLAAAACGFTLAGCQSVAFQRPEFGTPEYAAFMTSRGYDCGLSVQRAQVIAHQPGEARSRYLTAGQRYAVQAYKKPEACGAYERAEVAAELRRLAQR